MDNDLETVATAFYVAADDLLKAHPERVPYRPRIGISPRISDAELMTLALMEALLGFVSEARWLRHSKDHYRGMFPYLPGQSGYNKRLRKLHTTMNWLMATLARSTVVCTDDVWVVDSTPVECGRSRETARRSEMAGWAEYGYCASHSRYFWGLRLHLVCTLQGLPVGFALTGAKADEPLRQIIEPINDTPNRQLDLERHGGRTPAGVTTPVVQRLLAMTAAIWHNENIGAAIRRSLTAYDH